MNIAQHEPVKYGTRSYPSWAIGVGWLIAIIPILMIPVGLLHSILSSEGTISQVIVNKDCMCNENVCIEFIVLMIKFLK